MTNRLYYGDNLDVLRDHIPDESIDLVYLDLPQAANVQLAGGVQKAARDDSGGKKGSLL